MKGWKKHGLYAIGLVLIKMNTYCVLSLPVRWHQRDHFRQLNIVSQEETSIICGNYLITHGFHNKGTIIGEQYVNYPCKYKT